MAPRRGGGGSSGGSSGSGSGVSASCPHPFRVTAYSNYSTPIVYFVSYCLFFIFTLGVIISMCCVRKRHPTAKKLTGPLYLAALVFMLVGYSFLIIGTMLRECGTTPYYSYYNWLIPIQIFFRIATYLLLVIVVWSVNSQLQARLATKQGFVKIVSLVLLAFMGALTCGYIGLQSYNLWTYTGTEAADDATPFTLALGRLAIAYYVFYLLSVVAGGAISIMLLLKIRARSLPVGNLMGWIITLTASMFIWVLFTIIDIGTVLADNYVGLDAYTAFYYIEDFFQVFSFVAILFLAKSRAWTSADATVAHTGPAVGYGAPAYAAPNVQYANVPPPQQQYAYNGQPNQQYYYQQQPVYNGTPAEMNGNGHTVHVK